MVVRYIKKYKWSYLMGIITLFFVDLLGLYIPQFTGDITDGLESGTMNFHGVMMYIVGIALVGLGMTIGRFFGDFLSLGQLEKLSMN